MKSFVITISGRDRTGLVEALSRVVADHGGSWDESHMTELAGVFAGVALVRIPAAKTTAFQADLDPLREGGLLDVTVRAADAGGAGHGTADSAPEPVSVEVVGADRPGIVRDVSARLASLGVGIVDLRTWNESAAMAGSPLFHAAADLSLPQGVTQAQVVAALQDLSHDLMVDWVRPADREGR